MFCERWVGFVLLKVFLRFRIQNFEEEGTERSEFNSLCCDTRYCPLTCLENKARWGRNNEDIITWLSSLCLKQTTLKRRKEQRIDFANFDICPWHKTFSSYWIWRNLIQPTLPSTTLICSLYVYHSTWNIHLLNCFIVDSFVIGQSCT